MKKELAVMITGSGKTFSQAARWAVRLLLMCIASALILSSAALARPAQPDEIAKLKQLYDQKRYFELRAAVEHYRGRPEARLFYFRGALADIFYEPQTSIRYLKRYLAQARADEESLADAYSLLADNFVKLSDYEKAAAVYRTLLARYKQTLQPDELKDYENAAALYGALRAVPRQQVLVPQAAQLNEPSAEAGWSVPVEAHGQRVVLGLDTGANISLLAKSTAEQLGVKLLDQSISVGSIISLRVQPQLGFLPAMKIGSATIHNAIFIVLDDQALTFPDGFRLKGVIGFPVIAGLRKISFNSDGTISVARKSSPAGRPNMCLDAKDILFQGKYENKQLTFTLDTGAERSVLYVPFLHDFEAGIKAKYSLRPERFTGIGGTEEAPAYLVKDFALSFSGQTARLSEVRLLTKALNDNGKFYYGNVGQDLIKRFRRMTLDFDSMHIAFE